MPTPVGLWFDVGIKRYTTAAAYTHIPCALWFDVGIKRYTTNGKAVPTAQWLWFDVGIKRYTTYRARLYRLSCCGLM